MSWLKSIFNFLSGLLIFWRWRTERKDARDGKANSVKAAERYDENERRIDSRYRGPGNGLPK